MAEGVVLDYHSKCEFYLKSIRAQNAFVTKDKVRLTAIRKSDKTNYVSPDDEEEVVVNDSDIRTRHTSLDDDAAM
ncbi:hypothetical protein EKO04_002657 [Ascochyta lentis]|uniref:Uncharacterized protein n=1 Tax=Ascochyta lentis TaxID=205686 RepID=A0A8H7JBV0_9PLEO|nr:hypothetical protein EKO04_002657 [Ascochyta lentis]